MSRVLAIAIACSALTAAGGAAAKKAAEPAGPLRFECNVALLMQPQGQFTDSTPVTISFVADRGTLRDIHVVDKGGILYPGGNFRFVHKPDVISMEAVEMPAERPGQWSGTVEKKAYKLKLASGTVAEAVTLSVDRKTSKQTNRHVLVWTATHQPEGSPRPLKGMGGGLCAPGQPQESAK